MILVHRVLGSERIHRPWCRAKPDAASSRNADRTNILRVSADLPRAPPTSLSPFRPLSMPGRRRGLGGFGLLRPHRLFRPYVCTLPGTQILQLPTLVYNKASEVQRAARIQTNEKIQKILWGGKSNTRPACNHSSTHHTMGLIGMPPPFLDGGRPAVMCAGVREGFRSSPCSLGVEGLGVEGFRPAPRSLGVPKLYRKTEPNIDGQ